MAAPRTSTTVLLVRHGRTSTTGRVLPGRAPGLHLNSAGLAQADSAAGRLARLPRRPVALYTSPLERARETAAPIARALELRATTDRGLLECDFGDWTGRRLSALRRMPQWRTVVGSPSTFRFPGGESFVEMQARAWTCVERLAERHRGGSLVLVSHADPIKAVIAMAMGVPLDLFQRTVISTGSVSAIQIGPGGIAVLGVNHVGELSEWVPS